MATEQPAKTEPEQPIKKKKICCACPDTKVSPAGACGCCGGGGGGSRPQHYPRWKKINVVLCTAAAGPRRVHLRPRPRGAAVRSADRGTQAVPARRGLQRGCRPARDRLARCCSPAHRLQPSGSSSTPPPMLRCAGLITRGGCSSGSSSGGGGVTHDESAAEGEARPVSGRDGVGHGSGDTLPGGSGMERGRGSRHLLQQRHAHAGQPRQWWQGCGPK